MRASTSSPGRPTLLVFTLGATAEQARRKLLPTRLGTIEQDFHSACLDAALEAGRAAGCRLAVATEAELEAPSDVLRIRQRGDSFGARFRHAVRCAEAMADGPLVVVGTDVPDLCADHVRAALARLEDDPGRVAVGPSPDGGFYLLAAAAPLASLLAGVRFCRRDTLRSLGRRLEEAGRRAVRLEPLADLDARPDLERWLARRRAGVSLVRVARHLRRALRAAARPLSRPDPILLEPAIAGALGSRAPPR